MKPEGRKKVKFPAKRDNHPKKGWINWWENIADLISRNTRKQKIRKEIEDEIMEGTYQNISFWYKILEIGDNNFIVQFG